VDYDIVFGPPTFVKTLGKECMHHCLFKPLYTASLMKWGSRVKISVEIIGQVRLLTVA